MNKSLTVDEIHAMVDSNGKPQHKTSPAMFALTLLLGVPAWIALLPVSIIFMIGKSIVRKIVPPKGDQAAPVDSGIQVDPAETQTKREERKYDIVILGATGFTGGLAVRYLAKSYGVGKTVHWAIAGRSQSKLQALKNRIAKEEGIQDVIDLDTLLVDTSNFGTLVAMAKNTRVVMTTVGPFAKYGSPVVEVCAKYGTHYVDITGESDWVREMLVQWDATAQRTGAKIISHCGNDCLPSDVTVMMLDSALPEGEHLSRVVTMNEFVGSASGGSINTILTNLDGESKNDVTYQFDPLLRLPDGSKSTCKSKFKAPFVGKWKESGRYLGSYFVFSFLSLANAATVKRSNALRGLSEKLLYEEGVVHPDFKTGFCDLFSQIFLVTALSNPLSRPIARRFIPKPGEGPDMDLMENMYYGCVTGYGKGDKGSRVRSVLYFPNDIGNLESARMLSESALCLALDSKKLPTERGGFFSPATGLGHAVFDRLIKSGSYAAAETVPSANCKPHLFERKSK